MITITEGIVVIVCYYYHLANLKEMVGLVKLGIRLSVGASFMSPVCVGLSHLVCFL